MEVQVSVLEAAWSASSVLEVSSSTSSSVLEVEVSVLEVVMQSVQVVHLGGGPARSQNGIPTNNPSETMQPRTWT